MPTIEMPVPVFAIVGRSGSGKTKFIESLIPELRSRGLRVAYVKHCHKGFSLNHREKDSGRVSEAGAEVVVLVSPERTATIERRGNTLSELVKELASKADIVVAEGFKAEPIQKIEVFRSELGGPLVCGSDPDLLAVISDEAVAIDLPTFGSEKAKEVVDFLEAAIMGKNELEAEVELEVDGSPVEMKGFVKSVISETVIAIVSTLRGVGEPIEIKLRIKKGKGGGKA
ncbi:molybdopterin-guanine dinucleotide biosynthesis protein B [candidate division TA06 bacterium]|uniref:Molybdopterin-guanine dinucleotide biosynthesis protein B n=1 Tax=candidate division TA06 bacterium TaxID=2250710 RepID=A0A523UYY6_UNCT6|nr:MAG: molybdopterin-guanine dinucleotide biosynthesis protein B [candidate division TA06 bacterium]